MRNIEKSSKIQSTQSFHAMRIHLASISMKGVLCSCGAKERESPDMAKRTTILGLALTSSGRSLTKKGTI
jgi:hypothetical protein